VLEVSNWILQGFFRHIMDKAMEGNMQEILDRLLSRQEDRAEARQEQADDRTEASFDQFKVEIKSRQNKVDAEVDVCLEKWRPQCTLFVRI
jgi:hypothetical protein